MTQNAPLSPRRGLALTLSILVSYASVGSAPAHASRAPHASRDGARGEETAATAKLGGIRFEANAGQADARAKFVARAGATTAFFGEGDATFVLRAARDGETTAGAAVRMRFEGGAAREVVGEAELPGRTSYFVGSDPSEWRTNVVSYAKVRYREVWPGVDAVFYERDGKLEYDFEVAPGADARRAAFAIEGAERIEVAEDGALVVETAAGALRHERPVVYQPDGGAKRDVAAGYTVDGDGVVRFEVGDYDASKPLVIDPVVAFETTIDGGGRDVAEDVATDAAGALYFTGYTTSVDLPDGVGALDVRSFSGNAVAVKLDPRDGTPIYFAYLGGSGGSSGRAGAVDALGRLVVVGTTSSSTFPTIAPAPAPPAAPDSGNVFVARLGADGMSLVTSAVLGGAGSDSAYEVALDGAGNSYVTGTTSSPDFPVASAYQSVRRGEQSAFALKLSADGGTLVYSTYLGGSAYDSGNDICVDATGSAVVVGYASSYDFPVAATPYTTIGASSDAFVTKLTPAGNGLVYSTYLGGRGSDTALGVAVTSSGEAYVTGTTSSPDFPTLAARQSALAGPNDLFVARLSASGALGFSTYFGGSASEGSATIVLAPSGKVVVGGITSSADFPVANAYQPSLVGAYDPFVAEMSADGASLPFSTFFDGGAADYLGGIAVDPLGNLLFAVHKLGVDPTFFFPRPDGVVAVKLVPDSTSGPLDAPGALSATGGTSRVDLAWTPGGTGEAGFEIERRRAGDAAWEQIAIAPAGAATFVDTSVDVGVAYTYRVRAARGASDSAWSNEATATALEPSSPPEAPRALIAAAVSASQIALNWSGTGGETSFEIERFVSGSWQGVGSVPGGAGTFVDGGLAEGVTHQYRARAFNSAGASPYSNVAAARIPALPTAPGSILIQPGIGYVYIGWEDANVEEDGFKIERREVASGDWQEIGRAQPFGNNGFFYDRTVVPSVLYAYRVRAYNVAGVSAPSPEGQGTAAVPAAPADFHVSGATSSSVTLDWTPPSPFGGSRYYLERRLGTETEFTRIVSGLPGSIPRWVDVYCQPATTYVYRIRTFYVGDNVYSEWVETSVTTPPLGGGAVVTVTSAADTNARDAVVTLREAIMLANGQLALGALSPQEQASVSGAPSASSFDEIRFAIGSGPQTIAVTSPLPAVVDRLLVDGATQPGYAGTPLVEIDGRGVAAAGTDGLVLAASESTARAIAVNGFTGDGIELAGSASASACRVERCYVGVDLTGAARGNGGNGIAVRSMANVRIETCVVSGNGAAGVLAAQANNTTLGANKIGTNPSGTAALGNGTGVRVENANVVVGGVEVGDGNVISGNSGDGVHVTAGSARDVYVYGNFVGTNGAGTAALANGGYGVRVESGNAIVGYPLEPARNVISGNALGGVIASGASSIYLEFRNNLVGTSAPGGAPIPNGGAGLTINNVSGDIGGYNAGDGNVLSANAGAGILVTGPVNVNVWSNLIGTAANGSTPLGNTGDGIRAETSPGLLNIGSAESVSFFQSFPNVIANNGGAGVRVVSGYAFVFRNRIYANAGLAVDLGPQGPTPNDPGDGDTGPNDLQNAPVLHSAVYDGHNLVVQGTLDSRPSTSYIVHYYVTPSRGAGLPGDADAFVGLQTVTTDATGHATLVYSTPKYLPAGSLVTAFVSRVASELAAPVSVVVAGATPGSDTPGVYVAATGAWFLRNQNAPGGADAVFTFGGGGALVPLTGDWDGDGDDTPGLYDPATGAFFLTNANANGGADTVFTFGGGGALVPVVGDWNADGVDTIGLYDPATGAFFLKNANANGGADAVFTFGGGGALVAVAGDWDGDGRDTVGLYDPGTGAFFLKNANANGGADVVFTFGGGGAGLAPLAGDWNGDGVDTIGLYASATGASFLRNTNANGGADVVFGYGPTGVRPLTGDWDGM
jgi:hypothetical protein